MNSIYHVIKQRLPKTLPRYPCARSRLLVLSLFSERVPEYEYEYDSIADVDVDVDVDMDILQT